MKTMKLGMKTMETKMDNKRIANSMVYAWMARHTYISIYVWIKLVLACKTCNGILEQIFKAWY